MGRLSYAGDFFDGPLKHVEASVYANYFDTHLLTVNTSMPQRIVRRRQSRDRPAGARRQGIRNVRLGRPAVGRPEHHGRHRRMDGSASGRDPDHADPDPQRRRQRGLLPSTRRRRRPVPDSGQSNVGAFVLNEWTPVQRLTLSAGGRYDWFNTNTELAPLPSPVLLARLSEGEQCRPDGADRKLRRWSIVSCRRSICSRIVRTAFRQPTNAELFNSTATADSQSEPLAGDRADLRRRLSRSTSSNATLKVTVFDSFYKNSDPGRCRWYSTTRRCSPRTRTSATPRFRAWSSRSAGR